MISYYRFKVFLEAHLLNPLFIIPQDYYPTYSTNITGFNRNGDGKNFYHGRKYSQDFNGNCIFWYEELLNSHDLADLSDRTILFGHFLECREWYNCEIPSHGPIMYNVNIQLFANSEISLLKKQWIKNNPPTLDWYFFFHGFAALDWFRDFEYVQNICEYPISKVFICLNHIINNNRSYRLLLLSLLKEQNLLDSGIVSAPLLTQDVIKKEVFDDSTRLSKSSKLHIMQNLYNEAAPITIKENTNSIFDQPINYRHASAEIPDFFYRAFWNIVTETNFYDEKLHLTEKIFKPIAIKRPFILVSSPGNLKYLKSYGFKTFDKWIDESYDSESDHDKRLRMIVDQIKKLCQLTSDELNKMHQEMSDVLEYNHNHFFNDFKKIIVDELVDNFESCTKIYNLSLSERFRLPTELINFDQVKQTLLR
jgi:hypothetical protein